MFDYCADSKENYKVQGVEIANSGYGYTSVPMVAFIGGGGVGAEAKATISDGAVGVITVTDGGSGYDSAPIVSFVGIASTSASAVATLTNGSITAIRISNTGSGYTEAPTVRISDPYLLGSGSFTFNEVVTGSASSATALVESWNSVTNDLELKNFTGEFVVGEIITGSESGATYKVLTINTVDSDDAYSQNIDIETEADQILDFTEKNPFGTP